MLLTEFDTLINHDSEAQRISNVKWQCIELHCILVRDVCNDRVKRFRLNDMSP